MDTEKKLFPISYFNPRQEVRLSAYADTIVFETVGSGQILRAIRFGGYPEMVNALADAIYAGASITAQIEGSDRTFISESKRYERMISHDGIYAEATLLARDEEPNAKSGSTDGAEDSAESGNETPRPRKCMIFCPAGDRDRLFEEVDRKTAVPLIPAFRDYLLNELEDRRILRRLTVFSLREKLDAWALHCDCNDANIIAVVEKGLKSGVIRIPGDVADPHGFDTVRSVTSYLNTFGVTVAERIRDQFQPLFDPATEPLSPEILTVDEYIRRHAGYPLYDAQLAVAESVKRQLSRSKCAFIVAECGSGKTKIGAAAMAAAFAIRTKRSGAVGRNVKPGDNSGNEGGTHDAKKGIKQGTKQGAEKGGKQQCAKTFNLILCPSHVAKKWVREIGETLPDTVGVIVHSITELERLRAFYEQEDRSVYAIISKERARDGYMKRPAVLWNRRRRAWLCPDCLRPIEAPVMDGNTKYVEKVGQVFFRTENRANHKCPYCGSLLWTAVNPDGDTDWVKIGGYGWVFRRMAAEHMGLSRNEAVLDKIRQIADHPEERFPTVGACRRYPLSSYIRRRYSKRP